MSFEEWWYEQEGFGCRAERFFEDECERDLQLFINMKKWLEAAYEAGQEKRDWAGLCYTDAMAIIEHWQSNRDSSVEVNNMELFELFELGEAKLKEQNT